MIEEIEYYLNEILYKQLEEFKIKEKYINEIIESVRIRIYSIIKNWNDVKYRKALLLVGEEEGMFYEPNASKDIKCFVVVSIRNSKIETIGSQNYATMGMEKHIEDFEMKEITKTAIKYFKGQKFEDLNNKLRNQHIEDFYKKITDRYPIAWNAMLKLSNMKSKELTFDKIEDIVNLDIIENGKKSKSSIINEKAIVEDGISETYNNDLMQILNLIEQNKLDLFFTDSFKLLTRNFEKLLKTIEFVLQRDKIFVTCNFMLTNGYVAKRTELLKATHTGLDIKNKVKIVKGLPKTYANVLRAIDQGDE